jgi:hypothetical protein
MTDATELPANPSVPSADASAPVGPSAPSADASALPGPSVPSAGLLSPSVLSAALSVAVP